MQSSSGPRPAARPNGGHDRGWFVGLRFVPSTRPEGEATVGAQAPPLPR